MVRHVVATALLLIAPLAFAHEGDQETGTVTKVVPGSAAEAAGVQVGDRVLAIGGRKLATQTDLEEILAAHKPGDRVPLGVERDGQPLELMLTFGERPGGGVSFGIALALGAGSGPNEGSAGCLAWIEKTYRVEAVSLELGLDLADDYRTLLACVDRDARRMSVANALKHCDNVFKVHCSANDLLTEIGEAQVERCTRRLGESLGVRLDRYPAWRTCGQDRVYERYSQDGESSDDAACRAAFLDECATNIDAQVLASRLSPEQRDFVTCCSAPARAPGGPNACPMLDDGFTRGPCADGRPVCINRDSAEWLSCPAVSR